MRTQPKRERTRSREGEERKRSRGWKQKRSQEWEPSRERERKRERNQENENDNIVKTENAMETKIVQELPAQTDNEEQEDRWSLFQENWSFNF